MIALINSNALRIPLANNSAHVIACSPPYWGLRNYGNPDQLGQEESHDCLAWTRGEEPCGVCYVCQIRKVAREAWRVLRDDGTFWLNLGDSYSSGGLGTGDHHTKKMGAKTAQAQALGRKVAPPGLKPKELALVPARVALALQADGWLVRQDIIWAKDNTMPESVNGWRWERHRVKIAKSERAKNKHQQNAYGKSAQGSGVASRAQREVYYQNGEGAAKYTDCPGCPKCESNDGYVLRRGAWRPTKSHEYVFLLAKSEKYYCDKYAVLEPYAESSVERVKKSPVSFGGNKADGYNNRTYSGNDWQLENGGRNKWDVWRIEEDEYEQFLQWKAWMEAGEQIEDKDVWSLPTSGYAGGHFAVWPPDLVRPMLKAGTSEYGTCAECGAPWARIVEKGVPIPSLGNPNPVLPYEAASGTQGSTDTNTTLHMIRTIKNVGWKPTCNCGCDEVVPAIVLDIFCGSGTTLEVAREMGLFGVGLDISFDYLKGEAQSRLGLDLLDAWNNGNGLVPTNRTRLPKVPKEQLRLGL